MATNSNFYPAQDEMERGGPGDTSNSIKLVRDITYKVIPFCCFSLIIFSVGAVLVSTLAFDKPIPHQGALVVSILLLSFFVLFGIGITYLYYRKSHAHVSKGSDFTDPSRQDNRRNRHVAQSFAQMPERISDNISPAVPQRVEDGLINSDTLRAQAPSPNTYRKEIEDNGSIPLRYKAPQELAGSARQQNRHFSQQREHQMDKRGFPRGPNPTWQSNLEASQLRSDKKHNAFIQANTTSTPQYMGSNGLPDTHDTRGNTLRSLSIGHRAQPLPVMPIRRRPAGPEIDKGIPIQRPTVRGPRDMPGRGGSTQMPIFNKKVLEPPLPTSSNREGEQSKQLNGPALGPQTRSARGWQTNNGGRRRLGHQDSASPWPIAPAIGREMSVEDKRESVNDVLQFHYPECSESGNRTQYHDIPSASPRQLPIPAGANVAFAQTSLEGETQKVEDKELSSYLEYDIIDYAEAFRGLPQPQNQVIGASSPSIWGGRHIKNPMSNQDHDSPASNETSQKPIHLIGDEFHTTQRIFSFETAGTADDVRQNVTHNGRTLTGPIPSGAPVLNQGQSFDTLHLSAVPAPLKLVYKNQVRDTSRRSDDYNPFGYDLRMKPRLPTSALFVRPRPPTTLYGIPVNEVGEEEGCKERRVPKTPVQTLGREKANRKIGHNQRRPQIPGRRSSRKSKGRL
ncbi:hypothetical protein GQX73_g3503 [Xylaria multiplex]|uniref:Uncharacterized protein n=1 Tax=Xylaria multiplex TaxID=323545 RepID=A0A7C8IQX4_9PEZI|nr:hypothetical protein GQX73_g3503 [Xylaria multiplex]